jgi:hypothetical protein
MMDVDKILHELARAWEVGSLPGRQAAEFNAAMRQLHRLLMPRAPARERPRLRVVARS